MVTGVAVVVVTVVVASTVAAVVTAAIAHFAGFFMLSSTQL